MVIPAVNSVKLNLYYNSAFLTVNKEQCFLTQKSLYYRNITVPHFSVSFSDAETNIGLCVANSNLGYLMKVD